MEIFLVTGSGSAAIILGALALGIRHGIDWDHIAAITDITSATAAPIESRESWLTGEPGLLLTDESHHGGAGGAAVLTAGQLGGSGQLRLPDISRFWHVQREPLLLGSLYALGHGAMVVVLGLAAILFREILPDWIDPIMERLVGITLLLLAAYLFISLYRFFRGSGEFHLRSRWMLVFSMVGNAVHRIRDRMRGGEGHHHHHGHEGDHSYGPKSAFGIGLVHGIGAETGTQVLIIGAAVGAASRGMAVATLMAFVVGLLISNSAVTVLSTAGMVSAQRRQRIYVVVGIVAALFSLLVGLVFLFGDGAILPELDRYFRWIGGPA